MSVRVRLCSLIASLALSPLAAHADTIDQQYYNPATGLEGNYGQSFTPTLNSISFATFLLDGHSNMPSSASVNLYQGSGFGGTLLATSNVVTFSETSGINFYEFTFAPVALTPGAAYTLQLQQAPRTTSFSTYLVFGLGVGYAGGSLYTPSGTAEVGGLTFSEGVRATAVPTVTPEPSSLLLLGTGVVSLLPIARRRLRKDVA